MARGTTLTELTRMLRAETGRTLLVSAGVDEEEALHVLLQQAQEMLADEYDWPFLRVKPTKAFSAGDRYLDVPEPLNIDRIESVSVHWSQEWLPLERDIRPEHYSAEDPLEDERCDPVQRYDIVATGDDDTQIEIWPLPATAGTLLFVGLRELRPLTSGAHRADLDDQAIVIQAAATLMLGHEHKGTKAKEAKLAKRLAQIKIRAKGATAGYRLGEGATTRWLPRPVRAPR